MTEVHKGTKERQESNEQRISELEHAVTVMHKQILTLAQSLRDNSAVVVAKEASPFMPEEELAQAAFRQTQKLSRICAEIRRLAGAVCEKRSDISDVLGNILEGKPWDTDMLEHRYIKTKTPLRTMPGCSILLEYDTLTTLLRYKVVRVEDEHIRLGGYIANPADGWGAWKSLEVEYTDE